MSKLPKNHSEIFHVTMSICEYNTEKTCTVDAREMYALTRTPHAFIDAKIRARMTITLHVRAYHFFI